MTKKTNTSIYHASLLLAALSCSTQVGGFVPHHQDILIRRVPCHHLTFRPIKQQNVLLHAKQEFDNVLQANDCRRDITTEKLLGAQRVMGALSAVAWILM